MKSLPLILLVMALPYAAHAACASQDYAPDESSIPEDLTPPVYVPGTPVRYQVPIYNAVTREIIATASSMNAYKVYTQLNDLPDDSERAHDGPIE